VTDDQDFDPLIDDVTRAMMTSGRTPDLVTPVLGRLEARRPSRWSWVIAPSLAAAAGSVLFIATHRVSHAPAATTAPVVAAVRPSPVASPTPVVVAPAAVPSARPLRVAADLRPPDVAASALVVPLSRVEPLSMGAIQPDALTIRPLMTAPLVVATIDATDPDTSGSTR
jgi:hypothetical protein